MFVLIFFQHVLFELFPQTIFGKSAYLIIFLVGSLLLFYKIGISRSQKVIWYHIIIAFFLLVVKTLRVNAGIVDGGIVESIINEFPILMIPVFINLAKYTISNKKILTRLLLVLLIMQTILAILFMLGLNTINILPEYGYKGLDLKRYFGIVGAANANANINALMVTILVFNAKAQELYKSTLIFLLGIISVIPSVTRLAAIVIIVVYGIVVFDYLKSKRISGRWLLNFLIIAVLLTGAISKYQIASDSLKIIGRIEQTIDDLGDQKRLEKSEYGFLLLSDNFQSFALGVEDRKQFSSWGVSISDNSIIQISLRLGVPFLVLFLIMLKIFIPPNLVFDKYSYIYLLILLITLLLNNAVKWIAWTYLSVLGFYSISTFKVNHRQGQFG